MYLDQNYRELSIWRDYKGCLEIDTPENVITVKMIRECIKALQTLLGDIGIDSIKVKGNFAKAYSYTDYYEAKLLESEKTIILNIKGKSIKHKINEIETMPAVPSLNLEEVTYYSNMINGVEITWHKVGEN